MPHLFFSTMDIGLRTSDMLLYLLISVFTELPFGMRELLLVSPSNTFIYEMEGNYVEDLILLIPGVSLTDGKVYFYGERVVVTRDGMPVRLSDVIPQSVETLEFLGESGEPPSLNIITKRFEGGVPYSRIWIKTGDTLGFELKRGLGKNLSMYLCAQITDTPIYQLNIDYEIGEWRFTGSLLKNPSIEIKKRNNRLILSREYQSARFHLKYRDVDIGFGGSFDTSLSVFLSSKFEPTPLVYIVPQVSYRDSIIPKLSVGFVPQYEAMVFIWATPSLLGGGIRFRQSSIFFSSQHRIGCLLKTHIGERVNIGISYNGRRLYPFLKASYPFKEGRLTPSITIRDDVVNLGLKIIDVDIMARMRWGYYPLFTLSWEFWD